MVKVALLASFNVDLVMRVERRPVEGETLQGEFAMYLGGKGFNQAIAARRLGADVAVVGRVGDDHFGRLFLEELDREGIDRRAVITDPSAGTGVASVFVEPDGTNTIVQDPRANRMVAATDIASAAEWLAATDIAMLQLETAPEAAVSFASAMRDRNCPLLLNPAPVVPMPAGLLERVDVLVPNEIEAAALVGRQVFTPAQALAAADELVAAGPTMVAVTIGERGAIGVSRTLRLEDGAFGVPAVDTVGAGDAFCAALAVALAEGSELGDALTFANAAGALACTRHGAAPSMPSRREVEALMATRARRA